MFSNQNLTKPLQLNNRLLSPIIPYHPQQGPPKTPKIAKNAKRSHARHSSVKNNNKMMNFITGKGI